MTDGSKEAVTDRAVTAKIRGVLRTAEKKGEGKRQNKNHQEKIVSIFLGLSAIVLVSRSDKVVTKNGQDTTKIFEDKNVHEMVDSCCIVQHLALISIRRKVI